VEIRVSDLAKRSDDKEYPYESTGVRQAADPIQLDTGDTFKGTLHYVAEFLPALALKGVKFESRPNELQQVADSDENGGDVFAAVDSTPPVPEGITAKQPFGTDEMETPDAPEAPEDHTDAGSVHTAHTNLESAEDVQELTEMTRDALLNQQSGIIVFNILSGQLARKARVQVLLDGAYWPAVSTIKSRSTSACWDHVGEGFIRELDFSQVWLRLDENNNDDEKDNIIAEWRGDAKAFLRETLVCK